MRYLADLDAVSVANALTGLTLAPDAPLLVLLPAAESAAVPRFQAACSAQGLSLVGAIFPELIVAGDLCRQGAWLLPLPPGTPTFLIDGLGADAPIEAARIAASVRNGLTQFDSPLERPLLALVFDGLLPHIASVLDELYLLLANRVEYTGANSGNESFTPMPCVFDNVQLVDHGVIGMLLPGRHGAALEHGFVVPPHALAATATAGNCIAAIDWRPAFSVYQELVAGSYGVTLTPENFYQYGVHFPLGILLASGEVIVRVPVALREDGALFCIGEIPENAMLVVLRASDIDDSTCVTRLAERLAFDEGSLIGRDLLLFYCAGRRLHHMQHAREEIARLQRATGAAQVGGALSTGEIGSLRRNGYPTLQNECLVGLPWGA